MSSILMELNFGKKSLYSSKVDTLNNSREGYSTLQIGIHLRIFQTVLKVKISLRVQNVLFLIFISSSASYQP